MIGEPRLYAAMLGLSGLALVAAGALGRSLAEETANAPGTIDRPEPGEPPDDDGTDAVECPRCGVVNERGYRYCRACVGELPGSDGRAGGLGPPGRGSAL